jgi:small-conductance mechanosensitive channel
MAELTKTVLIDGLPVQMSDKDALIVQRAITQLQDQIENFKKKFAKKAEEEEEEEADDAKRVEDLKTKDALIETLKAQLKDAADPVTLDARLADRDLVRVRARALMGDSFKVDGKKIEDIRREVVLTKSTYRQRDWADAAIEAGVHASTTDNQLHNPIS